ncbi:cytochrome oxidase c assembly-domain-containing protein [Apodospora peruviana]|uniref:Cytochrome oxidase c assembly-domain-containing protein n=1 Tax=Apodospora peruviana TaxID=516989 RepID=A0AAE0I1T7_9PEZI|nr:cytochrome oxidase c assembly-domain-containing protein [Apodospora peruviana]
MGIATTPRSVSDATRFTPTTPHASSKDAEPRFSSPSSRKSIPSGGAPAGGNGGPNRFETPEQKVARLRAAHQRAKAAQVSKFDWVVEVSRPFWNSAHKVTVIGMIGFTALAGLVTVYTAADMMIHNRKRTAEFIEAQKKMEADSLEAARLAYMTNKATEDQIRLVEEAMERERRAGESGSILSKMPSILSTTGKTSTSTGSTTQSVTESATWPTSVTETGATGLVTDEEEGETKKEKQGLWAWMTSSLKREEEGEDEGTSERRLGYESLSEEDDRSGVRDSDLVRALEEKQAYLRDKAHSAFEKEKENERKGGPLDRVGLDDGQQMEGGRSSDEVEKPKKKGWLW